MPSFGKLLSPLARGYGSFKAYNDNICCIKLSNNALEIRDQGLTPETSSSLLVTTKCLDASGSEEIFDTSNLTESELETSKMAANQKAIEERIFEGELTIGIGSGSTVVYAVELIADAVRAERKKAADEGRKSNLSVVCIPSSFQAKQLIQKNKLPLGFIDTDPHIDWTIDGADEIDAQTNLIKGGGGCLTQEKMLAAASKELFIVADLTKVSSKLGTAWKKGIPIEVIQLSYSSVRKKLEARLGGKAVLRNAVAKAGPVVTDNGNFLLDWKFPEDVTHDWKKVEVTIKMIPGVVEVGLFIDMATKVYVGYPNGKVKTLSKSSKPSKSSRS